MMNYNNQDCYNIQHAVRDPALVFGTRTCFRKEIHAGRLILCLDNEVDSNRDCTWDRGDSVGRLGIDKVVGYSLEEVEDGLDVVRVLLVDWNGGKEPDQIDTGVREDRLEQ